MLSACIFKPRHYHLMSHFNAGLSILHIHICKMEDNTQHVSLRSQENNGWSIYNLFTVNQMFVVLIGSLPLWTNPTKINHMEWIGTWRRPFCWSSTPSPPARKMAKLCTKRKRKMWWFPILHEVQFVVIVPLRNNRLKPNDPYMGRTAPLTSKRCVLYIYSTNIGTEYFKHALYSPFFSLQIAVCFIMLTCLVPVLFTFYIQGVLKLKKIIPAPKG